MCDSILAKNLLSASQHSDSCLGLSSISGTILMKPSVDIHILHICDRTAGPTNKAQINDSY